MHLVILLITTFLGKPPGDSLPVLSAHTLSSGIGIMALEMLSLKCFIVKSPQQNVGDVAVKLWAACMWY